MYSGILLRHKKIDILLLRGRWIDPESIILSEVSQRPILCDITYMYDPKNSTSEIICKTETESQIQRIGLWLPKAEEVGEGGRSIGSTGLIDAQHCR